LYSEFFKNRIMERRNNHTGKTFFVFYKRPYTLLGKKSKSRKKRHIIQIYTIMLKTSIINSSRKSTQLKVAY